LHGFLRLANLFEHGRRFFEVVSSFFEVMSSLFEDCASVFGVGLQMAFYGLPTFGRLATLAYYL